MVHELMNDGRNTIKLVYNDGFIAQFRAEAELDDDGCGDLVYFNVSVDEAKGIIKGLQDYIDGREGQNKG